MIRAIVHRLRSHPQKPQEKTMIEVSMLEFVSETGVTVLKLKESSGKEWVLGHVSMLLSHGLTVRRNGAMEIVIKGEVRLNITQKEILGDMLSADRGEFNMIYPGNLRIAEYLELFDE